MKAGSLVLDVFENRVSAFEYDSNRDFEETIYFLKQNNKIPRGFFYSHKCISYTSKLLVGTQTKYLITIILHSQQSKNGKWNVATLSVIAYE